MSSALPVLVECPPYRTRLMESSCAKRHRAVNAKGAAVPDGFDHCVGCEIGAERAAKVGDEVPTLMLRSVGLALMTPGTTKKKAEEAKAKRVEMRRQIR